MARETRPSPRPDREGKAVTVLLGIIAAVLPVAISMAALVQLLYMEGLRLRGHGLPAHEYFKETIQPKLTLETEDGALTFSLIKQLLLILECMAILGAMLAGHVLNWETLAEAAFLVRWLRSPPSIWFRRRSIIRRTLIGYRSLCRCSG